MATTQPPIHSFSRTTRLPIELVQEIIQLLTAPTFSRQYGHDKYVLYALCQLCLVNHFFHDISAPYLYSSIVVTDTMVQLHALVTTLNASIILCSYTHSLLIPDFINYSCYKYETVIIPWVCDLLDLVNPYLRRLSLCTRAWHDRDIVPTIKGVLDRFTDLQEFAGTYFVSSIVWSDWKNLRYLLLLSPEISLAFITAISLMPRLTHLGLLIAYSHTLEPHRIIELSKAGGSLQKIIFSFSQMPQIPMQLLMQLLRDEFARTPLREGLDVRHVTLNDIGTGRSSLWAWPGSGSFWEADSDSLLAPCADLFDE